MSGELTWSLFCAVHSFFLSLSLSLSLFLLILSFSLFLFFFVVHYIYYYYYLSQFVRWNHTRTITTCEMKKREICNVEKRKLLRCDQFLVTNCCLISVFLLICCCCFFFISFRQWKQNVLVNMNSRKKNTHNQTSCNSKWCSQNDICQKHILITFQKIVDRRKWKLHERNNLTTAST